MLTFFLERGTGPFPDHWPGAEVGMGLRRVSWRDSGRATGPQPPLIVCAPNSPFNTNMENQQNYCVQTSFLGAKYAKNAFVPAAGAYSIPTDP